MPECYEVFRMANYLKDHGLEGSEIKTFDFRNRGERMVKNFEPQLFLDRIVGQRIESVQTKAKFTFIQLESAVIEWHYRFTGIPHLVGIPYDDRLYSIYSLPITPKEPSKYIRFQLVTTKGLTLHYVDTRCLSTLRIYPNCQIEELERYSQLPNDIRSVQTLSFREIVKFPQKRLKQFLQDPFTIPSGIGNYLACEICAFAGIFPNIRLGDLKHFHIDAINQALKEVHDHAISVTHYDWFRVFNRERCTICDGPVLKTRFKLHEQTTHWCEKCQQ